MSEPKSALSKHCKGCYYWRGNNDSVTSCCYIFIEDKRRPCPPGEGCTVRKANRPKKGKKPYGEYEK